jgi:hypothetical protein
MFYGSASYYISILIKLQNLIFVSLENRSIRLPEDDTDALKHVGLLAIM